MQRIRGVAVVLALAVAMAAAGCAGTRTVPLSAGSAQVATGETFIVDLGDVNESVGDSWHLVGQPDPAVLTDIGRQFEGDCSEPGCGGRLTWTFTATGVGSTTIIFQYCFRTRPDNCKPRPGESLAGPVSLQVVVANNS
jgi:inhibitor of cysteine peptidase